jgi:hypothetical protein
MKSARLSLWNAQPSQNPKAPVLTGNVELPAQLVWELSQLLQSGQGMEQNQQTGEQFFKLRISVWRGTGEANASVLNGQIQSPAEQAAYLASKAQNGVTAPQGQPWGAPQQAPQGPPPGYPQAPQQPAAAPGPWQQPQQPAAAPPPYAPQPAPSPAPPAWGGSGGWGG